MGNKGRLLFVINSPDFFLNRYLRTAIAARDKGYEVHVASMHGGAVAQIHKQGFPHHVFPMSRSGQRPWQELQTLFALCRLIRRVKPKVVHLATIKPVLYGGIASRFLGVPRVVVEMTGLGYLFTVDSKHVRTLRTVVSCVYKTALNHSRTMVIFLNGDNRNVLVNRGAVREERTCLIPGGGIDLARYKFVPEPQTKTVVMATRLLRDKGVREYFEAALLVKRQFPDVRFILAGEPDFGNPESVTQNDLELWNIQKQVDCVGFCARVANLYAQSNIVALPSYYGEGLPRSLTEAAACGRAVVTTDSVGCREAIAPGKTGLLVPVRDAKALAGAILKLLEDDALRLQMGKAGRAWAEKTFDSRVIVGRHLKIYGGGGDQ